MSKKINILLVDDTEANLQALVAALDNPSYNLECAHSGNDALALMLKTEYALVLLDIQMPEMDGYEVLSTMRLNTELATIPVILISAFDQTKEALKKGYRSGAVDFVSKPFDAFILNQKVTVFTALYAQRKEAEMAKRCLEQEVKIRKSIQDDLMESILETRQLAKDANQATKIKSEFLANMSHEIRTPMNGIVGFTDILLDGSLSSEQRDMVSTIKTCSDSLLELINDILDFSKIEAEKVHFENIPFDIEDVISEANTLVSSKIIGSKVQLIVDVTTPFTLIKGDPTKLRQILINLLGNAIKFTKEGEVETRLLVLPSPDKDTARFRIAVRDTGIGISKKQQENIFNPFSQADGSTTREYGGTGLGLSISLRLVAAMGSELRLTSEEGRGSEFYFDIDFQALASHNTDKHASHVAGKKLLLLENNQRATAVCKSFLEKEGIQVRVCRTIAGFEQDLISCKPDIVLASIEIDKKAIITKIEALKNEGVLCIALTTDTSLENIRDLKKSSFDMFMFRPVVRRSLFALFKKHYAAVSITADQPAKKTEERSLSNVRILMAEDNKINQKLQVRVLTKMGCTVDVVENGKEALSQAQEQEYDIILMDMQMPIMDGIEATLQLREVGYTKPIVAMTANAFESDRKNCLDAGMDEYITKPIKKDILFKTLRQFCSASLQEEVLLEGRLLIVEDDAKLLRILQKYLHKQYPGLSIMIAEDGIAASANLGSFNPDLILTDLMMPKMDGVELIRYIREEPRYAHTKVVAITGMSLSSDVVQKARAAGVDDVLTKPYKLKEIGLIVKGLLSEI